MATRTIWQDIYAMEMDNTNVTVATAAADDPAFTTGIGIQGVGGVNSRFSLALTDHPNFKAPSGSLDTEQATGKSTRQSSEYNVVQTGEAVQFALPLLGDAYNTSAFLKLLFQSSSTQGSPINGTGIFKQTNIPYSSADTSEFAWFARLLGGSSASGHDLQVSGGLCHTLTLSGESGGVLNIEPTIYGAKWQQRSLTAHSATLGNSFPDIVPLKFQDSTFAILDRIGVDTVSGDAGYIAATLTDWEFTPQTGTTGGTLESAAGTPFAVGNGWNSTNHDQADVVIVEGSASNDGIYPVSRTSDTLVELADSAGTLYDFTAEDNARSITVTPAKWKTVNVPSVSFTITNNCQFNYYNDEVASNAIVGRLGVEGSFQMPFGTDGVGNNYMIDRFLAGDQMMVAWYWGQSGSSADPRDDYKFNGAAISGYKNDYANDTKNYLSIVANIRVTDYEVSGDNEVMVDVTFSGAGTKSNDAVEVYAMYDSALLTRA
jgi:hypothetical protein